MSDEHNIFSVVPIEVALDHRLTLRHVRVLIALFSFRSKTTNTVWPKRQTLADRCGFPLTRISTITTELASLGWLEKVGTGGRNAPSRYRLTVPDLVTVTNSVTVTDLGTETVTKSVTETVTNPVTRKEVSKEVSREEKEEANASLSLAACDRQNAKPPTCPHEAIIGLYMSTLPELPRIVKSRWPGSKSETALRARWREDTNHQSLDFWQSFFNTVRTNPHWMGDNDRGWTADLHWLVNRSNFDKVILRMVNGTRQAPKFFVDPARQAFQ